MDVDLLLVQAEDFHVCESDDTEGFIDFKSVNIVLVDTGVLHGLWHGKSGCGGELGGIVGCFTPAKDLCNRLEVELLELGFGYKDNSGSAVGERGGVGGSDGTVLLEDCAESASLGLVELRRG